MGYLSIKRKEGLTLLLLIFVFAIKGQTANPTYNKALSDSLGADERGMKM